MSDTVHVQPDGRMYVCHACPYLENAGKMFLGETGKIERFSEVVLTDSPVEEPRKCLECQATYCAVCHANLLSPDDDVKENWLMKKPDSTSACEYYREFGKVALATRLALSRIYDHKTSSK